MTTSRIEEMVEHCVKMKPKFLETENWVEYTIRYAYQAGIDEAEETERNRIKEWVLAQVNEGSGQCIHYGEILEALQDQK